jgi:two-component system phosphate regulon sensor histidine kinase PhoR
LKSNVIRNIILLAFISLGGIIVTQIFWVKKKFDYENEEFYNNSIISTRNVINKIVVESQDKDVFFKIDLNNNNQFFVTFSKPIPLNNFERIIFKEFKENNIKTIIGYTIRDFNNLQIKRGRVDMVKKEFIPEKYSFTSIVTHIDFTLDRNTSILLDDEIKLLIFFSFVLLVVLGFFSYTIIIILKQKQLSQIKSDFVNNMTHEFKTPIATIALSSEVLMKDDIVKNPRKLKHYAQIINEENKRLRLQVESVLQVSQLESNKLNLNISNIDMHKIITEICKNFEPRIIDLSGTLELHLQASHHIIKGDEIHVKNILFNLLDNAVKYSIEKPIIKVTTRNSKDYIAIEVKDNGKGISKDDQKRIFEKFHRISSGDIHDVKGFGLGLFYVKNMMKQHKGFVTLKSDINLGSTFVLWFPYNKKIAYEKAI